MSQRWIILGDIRVNVAAQTQGDTQSVVNALLNLYDASSAILNDPDDWDN